jgi:conjugal transfer pilus assembly protein TraV
MRLEVLAFIAVSITSCLISGCSPMNSEFSCNATASDSCMTIEQVDAMTRFADGDSYQGNPRPIQRRGLKGAIDETASHSGGKVWLSQHATN